MMKKFTLGELADAIEKNGLKFGKSYFFKDKEGYGWNIPGKYNISRITECCSIGQGSINLGIVPGFDDPESNVINMIVTFNDREAKSFQDVADYIRKNFNLNIVLEAQVFDYSQDLT